MRCFQGWDSEGVSGVVDALRLHVCGVRERRCVEGSEVHGPSIHLKLGAPTPLVRDDSEEARLVSALRPAPVLQVRGAIYIAQIRDAVCIPEV